MYFREQTNPKVISPRIDTGPRCVLQKSTKLSFLFQKTSTLIRTHWHTHCVCCCLSTLSLRLSDFLNWQDRCSVYLLQNAGRFFYEPGVNQPHLVGNRYSPPVIGFAQRLCIIKIFTLRYSTIVLYKTKWIHQCKAEGNKSGTRRFLFEQIRKQIPLWTLK